MTPEQYVVFMYGITLADLGLTGDATIEDVDYLAEKFDLTPLQD
jgi:hypothetical protein